MDKLFRSKKGSLCSVGEYSQLLATQSYPFFFSSTNFLSILKNKIWSNLSFCCKVQIFRGSNFKTTLSGRKTFNTALVRVRVCYFILYVVQGISPVFPANNFDCSKYFFSRMINIFNLLWGLTWGCNTLDNKYTFLYLQKTISKKNIFTLFKKTLK